MRSRYEVMVGDGSGVDAACSPRGTGDAIRPRNLALISSVFAVLLVALATAFAPFAAAVGDTGSGVVIAEPSVVGAAAELDDPTRTSDPNGSDTRIWPLVVAGGAALLLFIALRGWALPRSTRHGPLSTLHLAALAAAMLLAAPIGATVALAIAGPTAPGAPVDAAAEAVQPTDQLRRQGVLMLGAYIAQAFVAGLWFWMQLQMRFWMRRQASTIPDGGPDDAPAHRTLRAVGLGVLTFAIAWPIVAATVAVAGAIRLGVTGEPTEQLAHETLKALDTGAGGWRIAVMLLVALAAPLFEEICFRGLMQPALRKVGAGPWTAIVLISTLFAVVHWGAAPPPAIAGLFVVGLAFGWARERSGGLVAPIIAHALFNIGNLTLAELM